MNAEHKRNPLKLVLGAGLAAATLYTGAALVDSIHGGKEYTPVDFEPGIDIRSIVRENEPAEHYILQLNADGFRPKEDFLWMACGDQKELTYANTNETVVRYKAFKDDLLEMTAAIDGKQIFYRDFPYPYGLVYDQMSFASTNLESGSHEASCDFKFKSGKVEKVSKNFISK